MAGGGGLPAAGGGDASSDLSRLAVGRLGYRGRAREEGGGLSRRGLGVEGDGEMAELKTGPMAVSHVEERRGEEEDRVMSA